MAPTSAARFEAVISGIAAQDIYHAGQIQLLKRLAGVRKEEKANG